METLSIGERTLEAGRNFTGAVWSFPVCNRPEEGASVLALGLRAS
jgi:hypothetical protein